MLRNLNKSGQAERGNSGIQLAHFIVFLQTKFSPIIIKMRTNEGKRQDLIGIIPCTKGVFKISIPVILFEEDDSFIAFCPSLDLSGYGKSEVEAKESFKIVLEEYFRYVENKDSLEKDLLKLGWEISPQKKTYKPPTIEQVLSVNKDVSEIYNTKPFTQYSESLSISAL